MKYTHLNADIIQLGNSAVYKQQFLNIRVKEWKMLYYSNTKYIQAGVV